MTKRYAVIFGLNYPGTENELNGCVPDANYWEQHTKNAGFDHVKVMLNQQCTKTAMVAAINEVASQATADDLFAEIYSGHGTIIPPSSQSLVPHDFDWDRPETWLTYDEIDRVLMPYEAKGVKLVAIHDACHSQADPMLHFRELAHQKAKNRFLEPPQRIKDLIVPGTANRSVLTSPKGALLLSGCQKNQTSADDYINGGYRGAFSYSLQMALVANARASYQEALLRARAYLSSQGYDQVPSCDGDSVEKVRAFFTV